MPALDAETILAATEEVLRRHGAAKATVQDVARVLGVSHAAVYRHFPSKAALREAVTRRWLTAALKSLAPVANDTGLAPPERLRGWLRAMFEAKRAKANDDPELFATYGILAAENNAPAVEHVEGLLAQLRDIISDGVATGDFAAVDPATAALAVFNATMRFHHPALAAEWRAEGMPAALDAVCTLLLNGLRA